MTRIEELRLVSIMDVMAKEYNVTVAEATEALYSRVTWEAIAEHVREYQRRARA